MIEKPEQIRFASLAKFLPLTLLARGHRSSFRGLPGYFSILPALWFTRPAISFAGYVPILPLSLPVLSSFRRYRDSLVAPMVTPLSCDAAKPRHGDHLTTLSAESPP